MTSLLIYICLSVAVVCGSAAILIDGNFGERKGRGHFRVFTVLVALYLSWHVAGCAYGPNKPFYLHAPLPEVMEVLDIEEGTTEYYSLLKARNSK